MFLVIQWQDAFNVKAFLTWRVYFHCNSQFNHILFFLLLQWSYRYDVMTTNDNITTVKVTVTWHFVFCMLYIESENTILWMSKSLTWWNFRTFFFFIFFILWIHFLTSKFIGRFKRLKNRASIECIKSNWSSIRIWIEKCIHV